MSVEVEMLEKQRLSTCKFKKKRDRENLLTTNRSTIIDMCRIKKQLTQQPFQ